ncbi:U3 small nucleolar RNA-associated protein 18 homolog isoform X2 [Monomorium pharaonis]|uniref:U3 small nucleolar RNA-associated protein 18 homolog isoform X2 n=1 Tax=Monomorium pharaonis TaxID=307658 RepID=UPI00174718CE|nr:U3 small nucleolar RNA-associated protein 18 homolog isoform X2 [Monomorium pharaonis]
MDKQIKQIFKRKNVFKYNQNDEDKGNRSEVLYNRKFRTPLRKKWKNEYDANEEARLEKIVFGDTSDIINNLLDDKSETQLKDNLCEKIVDKDDDKDNEKDIEDSKDSEDESKKDVSILNRSDDMKQEGKKVAWIDEDDYNYTVDSALNTQNRKLPCKRPEKLYTTYLENRYKLFVGTPKWAKLERNDNPDVDDLDSDILKVDGHTNDKLHSMQFKKYPISKATFMKDGTEILLGSQYYPYCHTYDLMNGRTYKLLLPYGITNMKRYEVSPDGKLIALCGRSGEIYLLHSCTKELVSTFKMNSKCRVLAFTPDNKTLITHGDSSEMYVWDMNTRTCVNRVIDDGNLSCTSLAVSPSGQFIATGSAQGVVNLYDMKTVLENQSPMPLKIVMNLVTSVTNLKFNPTSEILNAASFDKHNAFKMLHLPSFTVFSNFPTLQTNIGLPQTIAFSPSSGYLSISNRTSSALLYRLRHYGNY